MCATHFFLLILRLTFHEKNRIKESKEEKCTTYGDMILEMNLTKEVILDLLDILFHD